MTANSGPSPNRVLESRANKEIPPGCRTIAAGCESGSPLDVLAVKRVR